MAFPEKIWSYYQGEGVESFSAAAFRLEYIFLQVRKRAADTPTVLNVGIGNGYFESRCQQAGFHVCAMDPVEAAVASLRQKGTDARTGFLSAIPFSDNSFDFVVASEVLEHLDDAELRAGTAEISRVLKPGGRLLGTVPHRENLDEQMVVCPDCGKRFHRWGHMRSFECASLQAVLSPPLERLCVKLCNFSTHVNWKGKAAFAVRQGLLRLGIHGISENIFFVFSKRS